VTISGGAIYDWGAHYLDWTLLLMGADPVRVTATGHKRVWRDVTNEDQVRVRLAWADGREAEFVHSDVAAVRRPKLYLQGTRGTLVGHYRPVTFESIEPGLGYRSHAAHHAEAPAALTLATYESRLGLREERVPLPAVADFAFHANLADHLLLGEPLAVPPDSVRDVIAVLDAAQRSLTAGGEPMAPAGRA
jgi:predicted dehydrogenase